MGGLGVVLFLWDSVNAVCMCVGECVFVCMAREHAIPVLIVNLQFIEQQLLWFIVP